MDTPTDPRTELTALRRAVADLATWGALRLDQEHYDRQHIAEHLTDALIALTRRRDLPDPPL